MGWIIVFLCVVLYFIPTFIAWGKKKADGPIIINIFLGWTFIGWVIALAWAVSLDPKEPPRQNKDTDVPWKRWN